VVVHAEVQIGEVLCGDELEGGGLAATAVASGGLAGVHGGEETFGEGERRVVEVRG
jgi:hypothetical protein